MKGKISILIIIMLLCVSSMVIFDKDVKIKATGGGGNGGDNGIGLDMDYMYQVTLDLAGVVHNDSIWGDGIRKGRDFGSAGDQWTADYLYKEMEYKLTTLENVEKIPIEKIWYKPLWFYNYIVEVLDFNLIINGSKYNYSQFMPKNETYPMPTGTENLLPPLMSPDYGKMDYNHTFTNLTIVPKDLRDPLFFDTTYINVSCEGVTDIINIMGLPTYIPIGQGLPQEQGGIIFILEEEAGVESQLDNITNNVSSVILIHNDTRGEPYNANTSKYSNLSIGKVNKTDSNLAQIIEILQNNTFMVAHNYAYDNETFTFCYDFDFTGWTWGDENFLYVTPHNLVKYDFYHTKIDDAIHCDIICKIAIRNIFENSSLGSGVICHGVIAYDTYYNDTHLMWPPIKKWPGWANSPGLERLWFRNHSSPALQIFFVNRSVGMCLENISDEPDTRISGYMEQADNWIEAYNVVGDITIPHSPNDIMTIVSNRYDGWWSEAPGDSGAGAGIVMGIAKYFHDFDIKPKYNLTFLFTTGEERGYRGAWHYSHSHSGNNYNINRWIGLDQLGFNTNGSYLNIVLSDNDSTGAIVEAIAKVTDYVNKSGYGFQKNIGGNGLDAYAFQARDEYCDTIAITKGVKPFWLEHHRTGLNYQVGDCMDNQDRDDLNYTFEYSWGLVKYFCVNPDCWIPSNIGYIKSDSDDNDDLDDTILVGFDVESTLPHDQVWLNSTLVSVGTGKVVLFNNQSFIASRTEVSKNVSYTLPENESPGYYYVKVELYNSTGIIDEIINPNGDNVNVTFSTQVFLYPYNYSLNPPVITNISASPNPVGYGGSVTISADVTSNNSNIDSVKVNIYKPEDDSFEAPLSYNMTNTGGDTYEYTFNDTWQHGMYNYTIWAEDANGNETGSSQYSFNVSAQATVSVCTIKDEYGNNEMVNLTDPPLNSPVVGFELLDDGEVLRIWNRLDSYYFDTDSGIQLTNHYNEYWSHNVFMLGYYNNDEWNLIYRTDELNGFNKNITSDRTFVNATLWKDLSYNGYDFRLAIRYHLGVDDKELTVIPYIKNLDDEDIPYNLGFAWEIKDIQIDMTTSGDYIEINGTSYLLNQSLDNTYKNMDNACFYIREDHAGDRSESLYLRWDKDLSYKVKVEFRDGQYNAPVTLGIKIGTLSVSQEKQTSLFWYDLSEVIYYFNSYDNNIAWATSPSYMVDGSTSNYASTTLDGDVGLCDGNSCSTSDLGAIGIVELRSYGYYSGYQRDTILRPVFGGTTDGYFYPQRTNATPSWSEWSYITNDPYGPGQQSWTWNDVQNLDCKVIAEGGMLPFTLYCSKVEIRVRYTPNNDPVISDPVPADESTGVTIAPVLNITVSDLDGDNMNITWRSNSSGSWVAFGTNNSVGNGTYHQTMSNASVNGMWWYWKVNVTDGTNSVESSVFSFYTGYESKIKNTGSTNISGYVFMQVQYYDEEIEEWVVVTDCQNDTTPRTINAGEQFGLDTVFNGKVYTSDLIGSHGTGSYRVYACFRDPDGDVLVCDDETLMEDSYEFTLTDT